MRELSYCRVLRIEELAAINVSGNIDKARVSPSVTLYIKSTAQNLNLSFQTPMKLGATPNLSVAFRPARDFITSECSLRFI